MMAAALALSGCQQLSSSNPALDQVVPPSDVYFAATELLVNPGTGPLDVEAIDCAQTAAVGEDAVPFNFLACYDGGDAQGVPGLASAVANFYAIDGVEGLGTYCDPDLDEVAVPVCYVYFSVDGYLGWFATYVVYAVEGDVAMHLALIQEPPPDVFVRVD